MAENSYPYTAADGTCVYNGTNAYQFNVASWTAVPADSVAALQTAVAQQPVSVTIEADKLCFQHYKSAIQIRASTNVKRTLLYHVLGRRKYRKIGMK